MWKSQSIERNIRIKACFIPLFRYENSIILLTNDGPLEIIPVDNSSSQDCLSVKDWHDLLSHARDSRHHVHVAAYPSTSTASCGSLVRLSGGVKGETEEIEQGRDEANGVRKGVGGDYASNGPDIM